MFHRHVFLEHIVSHRLRRPVEGVSVTTPAAGEREDFRAVRNANAVDFQVFAGRPTGRPDGDHGLGAVAAAAMVSFAIAGR